MNFSRWMLFLVLLLLAGCSQPVPISPTPTKIPVTTPGPVSVRKTSVPDVKSVARTFLDSWKAADYAGMYALLTASSQKALSQDEFSKHLDAIASEAALSGVDFSLETATVAPDISQVNYQVMLHSDLIGDIQRDTSMDLHLEKGQWRVNWADSLILPELKDGNYLAMDLSVPERAGIYDRNGNDLATQTDATAIGLYPDNIDPDQEEKLFSWLVRLTGMRADTIQGMYENFPFGGGWYLPLAELPTDQVAKNLDALSKFSGLVLESYSSRYYPDGGIGPHVVGYVSQIQADEVDVYKRKGYRQDELVGRAGLEKWGESYLAGKRGGTLYVVDSNGQPFEKLGEASSQPPQAVYTTLDANFQLQAQKAIQGFRGAIVVLERDTGRVLAMVSSPGFDPNAFVPNYNSFTLLSNLAEKDQPLFNRAAQGQYPLGSVFKTVTMAAALESGVYTPQTTYDCKSTFDELQGITLYDWTYERDLPPSGMLTLQGGLIRSCNPYFYHIGLDLYNRGLTTAISDMARSFGLGSPTGIEGVEEAAGNVPDPGSQLDATNLAIGQGNLQVTPLQVADYMAAIGNGGTLYRPQLIEKIVAPDGRVTKAFTPEVRGTLPVKPENLKAIQEAMHGVVSSRTPQGTALRSFASVSVPVAGKTGTAQSGSSLPHAWFAGYTYAGREDKPDIAIAVVVENIGEGSDYAAPIFRRIVELYFSDGQRLGPLYRWEAAYNVTRTPTPEVTETPTPTPEPDATP